ncbi:hypothetical protein [Actinotalea solisilvae]|uniref:hypothetical protein n=1 Tax=Actinotalea solisilvae TaxID=2072922 RepID=UPI0018F25BA7|nr:hypothetical protein [Actinotalea solisilvae]
MRPRAGGWIAGAVFVVLAMAAGTWFLVAAPGFERASATRLQAQDTRSRNDLLEVQLVQLRADFEKLPEYRAELAALQAQIPTTGRIADYTRAVQQLADANGVSVVEMSPGTSTVLTLPTPAAPAPAPTEPGTEGDGTEAPDGTVDAAGAPTAATEAATLAALVPEGFSYVPLSLKVVGPFANVNAFLRQAQTGTDRLYLVTGLDGTRQKAADASGGKPAVADGDLELMITGAIFVLPDPYAVPVPPTEEAPVPLPTSERNPFAPLG